MVRKLFFALVLAAVAIAAIPTVANAGLVGLWRFGANVPVQPDSSGNNNGATPNGNASWVFDATRSSGVMTFDGDNDYLLAADSASLSVTGNMTVAAWINVIDTIGGALNWRAVLGKGTVGSSTPGPYQMFFNQGNLVPHFGRGNGASQSFSILPSGPFPSQGTWEHWAVSMSGTTATWYRNGSQIATGTINTPMGDTNGPLYIGSRPDLLTDWKGRLDDVAIFDEALTASQINTISTGNFNAFLPVPEPSMLLIVPLLALAAPFAIRAAKALAA